ncbi:winged helix-turn-helix domain-containing protein [Glycomyces buryatensis]|uniref:ArsR family transcriptional regulator n=1 Tax=Glycomyces buryatensis TaxID=2570927 RepID=A0A4S8Q3G5_9ACTN|nr:transcriptional regulator [Glycomyces buryatensis]THV37065.1 ArsR family transcriptional regulator [Glycomyces buryatensis]
MSRKPEFDEIIHAPNRLRICSMLSAMPEVEFAVLRDELGVSDSVLSKQLRALEEAGYVGVSKSPSKGRTRTWASLTPAGKDAFAGHVAELRRLADGVSL